jgi:choline dehydrogenase-like flavoprotein
MWANLGNPGWDWDSLKPYYQKFYTLNLPDEATQQHLGLEWADSNITGNSGPIQTSFTGVIENPMPKAWVESFQKLNMKITADPFSGTSMGAYSNMSTVDAKTKTRSYAASGYAAPAMSRPNLQIIYGAEVQKILLRNSEPDVEAYGVEAIIDGIKRTINATKEIILAAGAFQSPKILELSGIGGHELLDKYGINTVIDNPNVGENLQDHLMTGISFEVTDEVPTADPLMRGEPEALKAAQEQYQTEQKGPFCIGGIGSHAYLPVSELVDPDGKQRQADILAEFPASITANVEAGRVHEEAVRQVIESGDKVSGALFLFLAQGVTHENESTAEHGPIYQPGNFASIGCIQTHPLSKGSSHISSKDPGAKPDIDPRYFSHPLDLELMSRHLLMCLKVRDTEPISHYFKPDGKRNHEKAFIETLDDAKQYLVDTAKTTYHCCGTCSMRPKDQGGVVDSKLRVWGTRNLRVVDASVFPLISRGNTMSTVYAVAEKAADLIKAEG